jgi:hypothetical protein
MLIKISIQITPLCHGLQRTLMTMRWTHLLSWEARLNCSRSPATATMNLADLVEWQVEHRLIPAPGSKAKARALNKKITQNTKVSQLDNEFELVE